MRLAVIADVHGNLPALDAVLADLDRRGGADGIVDLGDRVSGPLWPAETFARFQERGIPGVRGNNDREVAARRKAGLGRSARFAWEQMTPDQRAALGALPPTLAPAPGVLAFHARPDRDDAYLLEKVLGGRQVRRRPEKVERILGDAGGARLVLCGHSHRPDLVRLRSGVLVLNPGSVGLPAALADDAPAHAIEAGAPDARYAVVDLGEAPSVAMIAVPYDREAAARRAEANGRKDWALWLRTGWAR